MRVVLVTASDAASSSNAAPSLAPVTTANPRRASSEVASTPPLTSACLATGRAAPLTLHVPGGTAGAGVFGAAAAALEWAAFDFEDHASRIVLTRKKHAVKPSTQAAITRAPRKG